MFDPHWLQLALHFTYPCPPPISPFSNLHHSYSYSQYRPCKPSLRVRGVSSPCPEASLCRRPWSQHPGRSSISHPHGPRPPPRPHHHHPRPNAPGAAPLRGCSRFPCRRRCWLACRPCKHGGVQVRGRAQLGARERARRSRAVGSEPGHCKWVLFDFEGLGSRAASWLQFASSYICLAALPNVYPKCVAWLGGALLLLGARPAQPAHQPVLECMHVLSKQALPQLTHLSLHD